MIKRAIIFMTAAAVITAASGVVYADACGVFQRNNEAAKSLVDRYVEALTKSYSGDDVSFRGIVKEGCDFWYYNDYNNDLISRVSKRAGEAEEATYSVEYAALSYTGKSYTIEADITQRVKYKGEVESVSRTSRHTFVIEQSGSEMYIVNDTAEGEGRLLTQADVICP